MKELQDTDPMPFGEHKGRPMSEVPASYLHWLWTQAGFKTNTLAGPRLAVAQYIMRNIAALAKEHPDGIWS